MYVPEGVAKPTVILKMEIYVCSRRRRQTDCHTEFGNICTVKSFGGLTTLDMFMATLIHGFAKYMQY